jgi:hypothetical protein
MDEELGVLLEQHTPARNGRNVSCRQTKTTRTEKLIITDDRDIHKHCQHITGDKHTYTQNTLSSTLLLN